MASNQVEYLATGRRKKSVARIILRPGTGLFIINGRTFEDYVPNPATRLDIMQPINLLGTEILDKFDILANVSGGGITGQAGAIRLGITRALLVLNPTYRLTFKPVGLITRDPRAKERKKYGLKKARRAPQFSKR
jgi:small subunit ribosomal protein S9